MEKDVYFSQVAHLIRKKGSIKSKETKSGQGLFKENLLIPTMLSASHACETKMTTLGPRPLSRSSLIWVPAEAGRFM